MRKKIILDGWAFFTFPETQAVLENEYDLFCISNKKKLLVLYFGFIPFLIENDKKSVQRWNYKVIGTFINPAGIKLCALGKYDIWVSRNLFGIESLCYFIISRLRGKKFWIIVKEWFFRKDSFISKVSKYRSKFLLVRSDFFFAYSLKTQDFLVKDLKIPESKVYCTPKPCKNLSIYDIDTKKIQKLKKEIVKEWKKTLIFVWRVVKFKWLILLLEVLKQYQDKIHLVVVGDLKWPYGEECVSYVKKEGLDVSFMGNISIAEVQYYYTIADLFVLPNIYCPKEYEAAEIRWSVVDEALYHWLPVVVTNMTWSVDDLVKGKLTWEIIQEGSLSDLNNVLQDFLRNPEKRKKYWLNGRKVLKQKDDRNKEWFLLFLNDIMMNKI